MEENELLSIIEPQQREKKPDSKFYNYLFAFFFWRFYRRRFSLLGSFSCAYQNMQPRYKVASKTCRVT